MVRDMGLLVYSTQGGGGGGVGSFWIPASVGCESGNLIAHGKESRRLNSHGLIVSDDCQHRVHLEVELRLG